METGSNNAINITNENAIKMKIDCIFQVKRIMRSKKYLDKNDNVEDTIITRLF